MVSRIQAEIAELDSLQTTITQSDIQSATVAVMVLGEVDTRPVAGSKMANVEEMQIPRYDRSALRQPASSLEIPG